VAPAGAQYGSWQVTHVEAPAALEYLPAVQETHVDAFVGEYLPATQAAHDDSEDAPAVVEYLPATQAAHVDAPAVGEREQTPM